MTVRKIVKIDEENCNGCGLCIPNCVEGALKIIDGKARLVSDVYCDGLGACLGHCPQDAISVVEREAEEFDEKAVEEFNSKKEDKEHSCPGHAHTGGCPGSAMRQLGKKADNDDKGVKVTSKLRQWPVQLTLVAPNAPYFKSSDLLITADCVPFAYANYHNDFLKDKSVVVGCPKLDELDSYIKKLEDIIRINDLESITVLRMEVPCCGGMAYAAKAARDNAGSDVPIKVVTIGIEGDIIKKEYV
jgi:ferredoxin